MLSPATAKAIALHTAKAIALQTAKAVALQTSANAILTRVIQANKVMPAVLADVIRKAPLTDEKVAFAWRLTVGPAVDKATSVRLSSNGTLYVKADAPAWNDAIAKSLGLIRSRLAHFLGETAVRRIDLS